MADWEKGEKEHWLPATNFPSRRETLRAYKRRMWVEEMFGDLKGNEFDLESTHLIRLLRLSRLTLAVVFLYVWLIAEGSWAIQNGQQHLVERANRRDLSSFQIGLRWVERCLTNAWPISTKFLPAFG